ncbi:flippase [Mannheimia massilioguelmaensis]|uniref:flippase n=1 Tax=Mannheimia massilioguelmaensis TaxID=1604354 RepID=UPI0005CB5BD0|nr:flippase [Mannheimia massilioguelmaensis]
MKFDVKSIRFNFFMNFILTVSNFVFPLITFPYVSRVLLPEGTGKVAFALSVVSYFSIFASFGVATYGVRAIARIRDNKELLSKTAHELLFINFISFLIVYIVFTLSIYFIPKFNNEKNLFFLSSVFILFTVIGVEWLYKGLERYQYITVRTILFKLIALVLVFIFIKNKDDYIYFAFISILAMVGSGLLNIFNARQIIYFKIYTDYEIKKHLKPMFFLFMTSLSIAIYTSVDEAILGLLSIPSNVGYYNAAVRIKGILFTFITSLGVVLLPRLSYYVENKMDNKFHETLQKSMNFIIVITLPLIAFFILFAKETILILAGNNYLESVLPLQIIVVTLIFSGITNILGIQILLPLKKDKELLLSVFIAALVDIIGNLILVPKLAAIGTAISVFLAELSVFIVQMIILKKYIPILFKSISYGKIILSLSLSLYISYLAFLLELSSYRLVNFTIIGIVFLLFYFLLLVILKENFVINIFHIISNKFMQKNR